MTRGEAAAPRNKSCQTSGALRWAQQLTGTALIEISKAPASGAAGARLLGKMPAGPSHEGQIHSPFNESAVVFNHIQEIGMQNIVRSRNGTYHRCLGIAGEHGRANCNQGLLTRLATTEEAKRASPSMFCGKCFRKGKPDDLS